MNTSERIGINDRPGHPNISPPAYRTVARCVQRGRPFTGWQLDIDDTEVL